MTTAELVTPLVLVSEPILSRNLARMAALARRHGVALRPHVKTHNTPQIARRQMAAGACGVTVATLAEARAMASYGMTDIFVAREMVDRAGLVELARLGQQVATLLAVDSRAGASLVSAVMQELGVTQNVVIEIDVGAGRCGLAAPAAALALAREIRTLPGLCLRGLFTHEGHIYGATSRAEMAQIAAAAVQQMTDLAARFREEGIETPVVSIGSSPSAKTIAAFGDVTEVRPGNYVFNDGMQLANGTATPDDCALRVVATVISRPTDRRAILNVGSKLLGSDRGGSISDSGGYGRVIAPAPHLICRLYEEHAIIEGPNSLAVGQPVTFVPSHACIVANLARELHLVDETGRVLETWPNARFSG